MTTGTTGTLILKTLQEDIDAANETINLVPEISSKLSSKDKVGL